MHLCYLLPPIERYSPAMGGAIATFAMQQGRRLQAMGYRVSVIAPHENEAVYPVGEFAPLHGVTRDSLSRFARGWSSKVRRPRSQFDWLYFEHYRAAATHALRVLRPDAVLCFNDWQTPLFVKKTLPQARVFLRLSNECRTRLSDISPSLDAIEAIFALSQYVRSWTSQEFEIPEAKFHLLPNGADLDSFFPASDALERILNPQNPVRALFISRLDPNKGPDLAADAVTLVKNRGLKVELSVAGSVWFRNDSEDEKNNFVRSVRQKAEKAGAQMLGHVARPEVPDLVRQHDVLLLPIRNPDPMTQVVFEAMACGLAVISCPLGGVPEACGEAALWAKPNDVNSLAALLQKVCEDRPFLLEVKKRSLERAQIMTWDRNAAIFHAVLSAEVAP